MQVCWGKLELNSAVQGPSRAEFDDPYARVFYTVVANSDGGNALQITRVT